MSHPGLPCLHEVFPGAQATPYLRIRFHLLRHASRMRTAGLSVLCSSDLRLRIPLALATGRKQAFLVWSRGIGGYSYLCDNKLVLCYSMNMRATRTIRIQLKPTPEQATLLQQTMQEYT